MDDIRNVEEELELEEMEDQLRDAVLWKGNHYKKYLRKLRERGRRILASHMWRTATYVDTMVPDGETPVACRILNYNEGSGPKSVFRVYCSHCGRMRTLIIFPGRYKVELMASCVHIREEAVQAIAKDRRLVHVGHYRVVPAGLAKMLGLRIIG
jgi:hypothetical protein